MLEPEQCVPHARPRPLFPYMGGAPYCPQRDGRQRQLPLVLRFASPDQVSQLLGNAHSLQEARRVRWSPPAPPPRSSSSRSPPSSSPSPQPSPPSMPPARGSSTRPLPPSWAQTVPGAASPSSPTTAAPASSANRAASASATANAMAAAERRPSRAPSADRVSPAATPRTCRSDRPAPAPRPPFRGLATARDAATRSPGLVSRARHPPSLLALPLSPRPAQRPWTQHLRRPRPQSQSRPRSRAPLRLLPPRRPSRCRAATTDQRRARRRRPGCKTCSHGTASDRRRRGSARRGAAGVCPASCRVCDSLRLPPPRVRSPASILLQCPDEMLPSTPRLRADRSPRTPVRAPISPSGGRTVRSSRSFCTPGTHI